MKDLQKKLRASLVQATPVMVNKDATIDKVCAQIRDAGAHGAELIVFPESLIPCYPYGLTYGYVTYKHLRAHETKANNVCRLLLEKKKYQNKKKKEKRMKKK